MMRVLFDILSIIIIIRGISNPENIGILDFISIFWTWFIFIIHFFVIFGLDRNYFFKWRKLNLWGKIRIILRKRILDCNCIFIY